MMNQKLSASRGKPGNKLSEIDMLDKEAKEMERNLKNLQERMLQQNIEDEATPKYGGSRWKSARPDKGSVTSYAKDIQEKHRRKIEDPAFKSQSAPRSASQKEKVPLDFRSKDIEFWTVADVFEWLTFAQLSDYSGSFRANEISGPLLLEITLDDLDYMGVTKLGHRKTILKSIEDLKKNKRITLNLTASHEGGRPSGVATQSTSNQLDTFIETNVKKKEALHWSHLEPLSATQVPARASSSSNINAADDAPDILDEAAERAAFQEAVAGWRGSGGAVKIVRESDGDARKEVEKPDSSMWCNPFLPMSDELDEDNRQSTSSTKVSKCDTGSTTEHTVMKHALKRSAAPDPKSTSSYLGGSPAGDVPLYQGNLDEAAEHQEFVKAVEAWRNRGNQSEQSQSSKTGVNGNGTGTETIPIKSSIGGASASALAMAAKISSELEDEQNVFKRRMSEQRDLLQASINRNAEIKLKENMQADHKTSALDHDVDSEEKHSRTHACSHSESIRTPSAASDKDNQGKMRNEDKNTAGSRTGGAAASKENESKILPESPRSYTAVSLKQSTMGLPDFKTQQNNEAAYIVDEGSDDDA